MPPCSALRRLFTLATVAAAACDGGSAAPAPDAGAADAAADDAEDAAPAVDAGVDAIPPDASPWPAEPKDGDFVWGRAMGSGVYAVAMDVGADGAITIAAEHLGALDLGAIRVPAPTGESLVVIRLDPGGEAIWARTVASSGRLRVTTVAAAADGDVVVAGSFQGDLAIGDPPLVAAGREDAYLIRFAADGTTRWVRTFATAGSDEISDVAVSPDGAEVTAIGEAGAGLDLGGGPLGSGVVLARFTGGGEHVWSRGWPGSASITTGHVALTADGGVVATSRIYGITLDDFEIPLDPGDENGDLLVAGFTPDGRARWVTPIHDQWRAWLTGVAVAVTGEVFLAANNAGGQVVIDDHTVWGDYSDDPFVIALTGDGDHLWSRLVSVPGDAHPYALAVDDTSVYVSASCRGNPRLPEPLTCEDGSFVAAWNHLGEYRWSSYLGGWAEAIAVGGDRRLYVAGDAHYQDSMSFDGVVIDRGGLYLAEIIP
jgi:hypothetical protein